MLSNIMIALNTLLLSLSVLGGATYYVDPAGPNDPGTGTVADPYRRINDAVQASVDTDTIILAEGVYAGSGNVNLELGGRAITIQSVDPENPACVQATVLDAMGSDRVFNVHQDEGPTTIIRGLTIKNGMHNTKGAGILCDQTSPTIEYCHIIACDAGATGTGGGIHIFEGSPLIRHCLFMNNTAAYGGAIECWLGNPQISHCLFIANSANQFGGALDFGDTSNATITQCTLVANTSNNGGGLVTILSTVDIENSILWDNAAPAGPQIMVDSQGTVNIDYCNVQGGQADVAVAGALNWGTENFQADPCFAFYQGTDPTVWDFHLTSRFGRWSTVAQTWVLDPHDSPAIDAGNPARDWAAESWPNGKRVNLGAYGATIYASRSRNPADLNGDGWVNVYDYQILASSWRCTSDCVEDIDGDNQVNWDDLVFLANQWLWQAP